MVLGNHFNSRLMTETGRQILNQPPVMHVPVEVNVPKQEQPIIRVTTPKPEIITNTEYQALPVQIPTADVSAPQLGKRRPFSRIFGGRTKKNDISNNPSLFPD